MTDKSFRNTRINRWLLPLSWLYGLCVVVRNELFNCGLIRQRTFGVPTICVGNITVGGTGKTPHTEYLVRLLQKTYKVAVLSRGYKRKSKGFVLATDTTPVAEIGDEPYQMKHKYPNTVVAVDANRCRGIENLLSPDTESKTDVILLDDAYQHRYVKAGVNILLVDYNRLISYDCLLPAGRLREPACEKDRAHIVIVTKCPSGIKPMDYRILRNTLSLRPYQQLYFSEMCYGELFSLYGEGRMSIKDLGNQNVMLLTGIAQPQPLIDHVEKFAAGISPLTFADHHNFSAADVARINTTFAGMEIGSAIIVTTEKDASRLQALEGLSEEVKRNLFVLPIEVAFLEHGQPLFNKYITTYVRKNTRNCSVDKTQT